MMTNQETMNAARENAIEKIEAMPYTITMTNMETFEDEEISTVDAKPILIDALRKNTTFIPAFSPADNLSRALINAGVPQNICDIFDYAMGEN